MIQVFKLGTNDLRFLGSTYKLSKVGVRTFGLSARTPSLQKQSDATLGVRIGVRSESTQYSKTEGFPIAASAPKSCKAVWIIHNSPQATIDPLESCPNIRFIVPVRTIHLSRVKPSSRSYEEPVMKYLDLGGDPVSISELLWTKSSPLLRTTSVGSFGVKLELMDVRLDRW
jgi:hypothetical protein